MKTANERDYTAPFQTDSRQCDNPNTLRIPHRMLINLFGRNEQCHIASALSEFLCDGHPREQMATCSAAGDRDGSS